MSTFDPFAHAAWKLAAPAGFTGTAAIAHTCDVLLLQLMVVVPDPVSVLPAYLINPPPANVFHREVCEAPTERVPLCTITSPSETISVAADETLTLGVVLVPVAVTAVPSMVV